MVRVVRFRSTWLFCGVALSALLAFAPRGRAQSYAAPAVAIGPSPMTSGTDTSNYGTNLAGTGNLAGNTAAGAVSAILPTGSGLYIGTVNGGVWKTTDAGQSWTPLLDKYASLSVSTLTLDTKDATQSTLLAGIGAVSNAGGASGPLTGVLRSTNGGASWAPLAGNASLAGKSVTGLVEEGSTIVASTNQGLYVSDNTGASFTLASRVIRQSGGTTRLVSISGNVTSMVADPSSPGRLYAALVSATGNANFTSVLVSNDSGKTWTRLTSPVIRAAISSSTNMIQLAAGANGALAIGIANANASGKNSYATSVLLSQNSAVAGGGFVALNLPSFVSSKTGQTGILINTGGQALTNFKLGFAPGSSSTVYVSGDTVDSKGEQDAPGSPPVSTSANPTGAVSYTATVFRLGLDATGGVLPAASITNIGTALPGSAPHADTRGFAFLADGTMLLASDGGLYSQSGPSTNTGVWSGLNGANLQAGEVYKAVFDPTSRLILFAAQDNGAGFESKPQSTTYTEGVGGDGFSAAVNSTTLAATDGQANGKSVLYIGNNNLGIYRYIVDGAGKFEAYAFTDSNGAAATASDLSVTLNFVVPGAGGKPVTISQYETSDTAEIPLAAEFQLNRAKPTMFSVGAYRVYVGVDDVANPQQTLQLTDISGVNYAGTVTGISYGAKDNPDALLAAVSGDGLYLRTAAGTNLQALSLPNGVSKDGLRSVVFSPDKAENFVFTDQRSVFGSTDSGQTIQTIGAPANTAATYGVEYISNNGVSAVFLGAPSNALADGTPANASPVFVSTEAKLYTVSDGSQWQTFATQMPNVIPYNLAYDPTGDVMTIATLGRGIYVVYDVTSNFTQARQLQFGFAGNNSSPAAYQLTDGTDDAGRGFSRGLVKQGIGTLFLNVPASYTGATTVNAGTLQTGAAQVLPSLTALTLATDSTFNLNNFNQTIGSLAGGGTVMLGSATLSTGGGSTADTVFDGVISGTGGLTKDGTGRFFLSGANTYSGPTHVRLGVLGAADASSNSFSPNSAFTVDQQATLALFNTSQTIGSLAGSGLVEIGTGSLTTGGDNTSTRFDGDIQGSGTLAKAGTGSFTLTGQNAFTGVTSVTLGTLVLASGATLAGSTQVMPGAQLVDGGAIAGNVDNAGTITANGGSIAGNLTLRPRGTMQVLAQAAALKVAGTTTLGGTLVVAPTNAWPGKVPLDLGGPATGRFAEVVDVNRNTRVAVSYSPAETDILLNAPGFAAVAEGAAARAVGAALDGDYTTASGAYALLQEALVAQGLAGEAVDLPQLTGAGYADLQSSALQSARLFQNTLASRISGLTEDQPTAARDIAMAAGTRVASAGGLTDTGLSLLSLGDVAAAMPRPDETRVWLQGVGQLQNLSGNADTPGAKASLGGVALGVERAVNGLLMIGGALGFDSGQVTTPALTGTTQQSDWHAAVYGRATFGQIFVGGSAEYSRADATARRQVAIGSLGGTISGRSLIDILGAQLEAGTNLKFGATTVQPIAALQILQLTPQSFSETGSTGAELAVAGQNQTALRGVLGANVSHAIPLAQGGNVTPMLSVGWGHEFLNSTSRINATFLGGGTGFTVSGTRPGSDEALLGAAVAWQTSAKFQFYGGYNASLAARQTLQSASLGLRLVW